MPITLKQLQDIANLLRRDVLEITSAAGSGHATSCLSCAELMSCLWFEEMQYDTDNANNPDNDEFIMSKGHAAPIYYSVLKRANLISEDLFGLRRLTSDLEGHPIPNNSWIKFATGSLGQGLSIGVGIALAAKLQKRLYNTYVLMGDSECAEGSVWEAVQLASYYKLDNLCAIVDINKLGQRGETMLSHHLESYKKRFESFNWNTIIVNGHNISEILKALKKFKSSKSEKNKPCVILAKTIKGHGVSFLEGKNGWHGKALNDLELQKALKEISKKEMPQITIKKPLVSKSIPFKTSIEYNSPKFYQDTSTREAYGFALQSIAQSNSSTLVLDAEVSNSTFAEKVKLNVQTSKQFVECFIAEQNMISMSLGLSSKGHNVFASTFASFLSRAHDQLRMSAISKANLTVCGSHCGVSIGEDGASQMGLDDIAMFRTLPNSIIFYPCDAVSTQKLLKIASEEKNIKYIRTTRGKTPIIYNEKEEFLVGEFKVVKSSNFDSFVLVGAGITLHECLKAHEKLEKQGIKTSVIDLYCIKPFNSKKFIDFAMKHGSKIIIAEDHYPEGGIGEMLSSSIVNTNIKLKHLAVTRVPHSGTPEELLEKYEINANAIIKAVKGF